MTEIKVSIVSYLNSAPFLYGLKNKQEELNINLSEDFPSVCSDKLINNKIDIGLVPVFTLPFLDYYEIISDYCIGSEDNVETVLLLSNTPLKDISKIHLDSQSRTSINLAKILAKKYWNINPDWEICDTNTIEKTDSVVIIGEKAFKVSENYKYKYDLSSEWKKYTGLPFVFACWVANKPLPKEFTKEFNNVISFGVSNKLKSLKNFNRNIPLEEAQNYITKNISYNLDSKKKQALKLYLELLADYDLIKF